MVTLPPAWLTEATTPPGICNAVCMVDGTPITGTVVSHNATLADEPELINAEPYAAGWLVEIAPDDPAAVDALLDADAYRALTEN